MFIKLLKKLTLGISLSLVVFLSSTACVTNVFNCPEDALASTSCPTQEAKNRQMLLIFLLILR